MKKSDIQARMDAIDVRLKEFPAIAEKEQRKLTAEEEKEKNDLIAERGDLQRQLSEIEAAENRSTPHIITPAVEEKPFSLLGEIRNIVDGGHFTGKYAEEVRGMAESSHLEFGTDTRTILMKASAPQLRTLNGILTAGDNYASNNKNGGLEMVRTDVLPIIEALYNYTILDKAGAQFYNGLVGNAQIPVMSNIAFGWKAENAAADNVTPTMGKVTLSPQRMTGVVKISKQLLRQTSEDLEARLRLSIAKAIAQTFEKSVLGYATSPHNGILNRALDVALASVTYDTVLELAESMYGINLTPTFVVDPKAARFLKQKTRLSNGREAIMSSGMVDDEQTFITNNLKVATVTSGAIACADFSRLHIGTWGDLLEITVDTVTRAAYGEIQLILNYYCDWAWDDANGNAYNCREITNA